MLSIVIKTQFTAIHHWPAAPDDVAYLRGPHRHVFYVTMKWGVTHEDRDMEFIQTKNNVDSFIRINWHNQYIGFKSCENLAITLANKFDADFVSVFEDNENGAEYVRI